LAAATQELIVDAVRRFVAEVPGLSKLKLVFSLELRGRGDVQVFRVELPGPKVTKVIPEDARVEISIPRSHFNELAAEGKVSHYRDAYEAGHIRITGSRQVMRLIGQVIERHEQRARLKKVH
jgi:hypothetical protein